MQARALERKRGAHADTEAQQRFELDLEATEVSDTSRRTGVAAEEGDGIDHEYRKAMALAEDADMLYPYALAV